MMNQSGPEPEHLSHTPQPFSSHHHEVRTPMSNANNRSSNMKHLPPSSSSSVSRTGSSQQQQQQEQGQTPNSTTNTQISSTSNNIKNNNTIQRNASPKPERLTSNTNGGSGDVDEYRISPVTVSVEGPLSLRFPGSDFAEVSVPSLSADVLVIASMADSHANGECSLGIHRSHVKNARLERESGVIHFEVQGVRCFGDSTIRLRAQDSALELATKLLWLVTGQSSHASPAPELVTRAANALHAIAALKQESKKQEHVTAANFLNERRMNRRKVLQDKWDREENLERESHVTRNSIMMTMMMTTSTTANSPMMMHHQQQSPGFQRAISEIMKDSSPVVDIAKLRSRGLIFSSSSASGNADDDNDEINNKNNGNRINFGVAGTNDARAIYADQLRSMLMKGLGSSPLHS